MAVKNYGIRDQWTNLDKLNNVDIKSVDGVIESVKINGEEAGGGGGSSDFSAAEVTVVGSDVESSMPRCVYEPEAPVNYYLDAIGESILEPGIYTTVLYKGCLICKLVNIAVDKSISLSGNCQWLDEEEGLLVITGDCTITIS